MSKRRRPLRPLVEREDGTVGVPLYGGGFAVIDAIDASLVGHFNWGAWHVHGRHKPPYICTTLGSGTVYLQRLIVDAPPGRVVDHINGETWDNRRANLRHCLPKGNCRNRGKTTSVTSSRYKGVCLMRSTGMWRAQIGCDGRSIILGIFESEEEAALEYDEAARQLFGEFARLNFK